MKFKSQIMDEVQVRRSIIRMSHEIIERNRGLERLVFVGLLKRGFPLAKEIAAVIRTVEGKEIPVCAIDIPHYRELSPLLPVTNIVKESDFPFSLADANVILIDDVLYTGRKSRAAMEALTVAGLPKTVQLAVLIDRGNRELPIAADYVGKIIPSTRDELVSVNVTEIDGKSSVEIYSIND